MATVLGTGTTLAVVSGQAHAAGQHVTASSSIGGQITRQEVLQRAQNWIDRGVMYSQSDYTWDINHSKRYRQDCSGFVAMAWHADGDYYTGSIESISHDIALSQLQPGDAMLRLSGGHSHIAMFLRWADSAHTGMVVQEESDYGLPALQTVWKQGKFSEFHPIRYDKISAGGGTPSPTPPPTAGTKQIRVWATDVNVRSGPRSSTGSLGKVSRESVDFSCETPGEAVSAHGYRNNLWSYSPSRHGYISNVFLSGGHSMGLKSCAASRAKPKPTAGKDIAIWATDVNVRASATSGSAAVRKVGRTTARFSCEKHGQHVNTEGYSNDLWSYSPQLGGYINNIFLKGGTSMGLPTC